MTLFLTPLSLIPALFVWQWPDLETLGYLIGLGGTGTLAHLLMTIAYGKADASAVISFDYTRLPFVAVIAFFLFGEVPVGLLDLARRRGDRRLGDLHRAPRGPCRQSRRRRRGQRVSAVAAVKAQSSSGVMPSRVWRALSWWRSLMCGATDAQRGVEHRRVVDEAHGGDEVRDHVGRQYEIGQRTHDDRLDLERGVPVDGAVVGRPPPPRRRALGPGSCAPWPRTRSRLGFGPRRRPRGRRGRAPCRGPASR